MAGLAWLLTFNILISLGILVLCWVLPRIVMKWAQRQRIKKFEKQLPDALLSLASTLRAGASFSVALGALLDYSQAPLSEEFGLIEREHRFGVTFSDAFKHLSQRMPSRCVEKIVAAILVSHQTGGELAQTLESTASSMQADLYAQERLSALTAQGVMQAWVMAAMPIGLAMMMNMLDDTFSDQLFNTSVGQRILWAIILLEIIGLWWLKKITRVTYA